MSQIDLFNVEENAELGRFGVASKDLSAGEVFLHEVPFAYGPQPDTEIICLHCYGQTDSRCPKCGWPACDDCVHVEPECDLFSSRRIKFYGDTATDNDVCAQLDCITPLRMLLAMDSNPERFEREILPMEYHDEARRRTKMFQVDQNNVVNYVRMHMKLDYAEETIQRVLGVLTVNSFGARSLRGFPLRVVYPRLAILAHNCVPNTAHSIFPSEGYRIVGRVTVDVSAGTNLYACYTYTNYGTVARQAHLKESKYFVCRCCRCVDPTELGTHISTLKCQKCSTGLILPIEPVDDETLWKCSSCTFELPAEAVARILSVIQDGLADVLVMQMTGNRVEVLEAFLKKYVTSLHPSHFILMNVRHNLSQLYGRVSGYRMLDLTDKHLERMIELTQEILRVTDIIEPGLTRSRAILLYEIHMPMILLAKSKFNEGTIDSNEYKKQLNEVVKTVKESHQILEFEDEESAEGKMASIAKTVLESLESIILSLD